jgi:hypothetical protein
VDLAPEVFELDDIVPGDRDRSGRAPAGPAEACPSAAIQIIDARTCEQLYP